MEISMSKNYNAVLEPDLHLSELNSINLRNTETKQVSKTVCLQVYMQPP